MLAKRKVRAARLPRLLLLACMLAGLGTVPSTMAQTRNAASAKVAPDSEDTRDCAQQPALEAMFGIDDTTPYEGFALRMLSNYLGLSTAHQQLLNLVQGRANTPSSVLPGMGPGRAGPVPAAGAATTLQQGNFNAAEASLTAALQAARHKRSQIDEAGLLNDLGVLDAARGRGVAAIERFQQAAHLFDVQYTGAKARLDALNAQTGKVNTSPKNLAESMAMIQAINQLQGRLPKAGLDVRSALVGRAVTRLNEANMLGQMGQRAPAVALLKQVLAAAELGMQGAARQSESRRQAEIRARTERAGADEDAGKGGGGYTYGDASSRAQRGASAAPPRPALPRPAAQAPQNRDEEEDVALQAEESDDGSAQIAKRALDDLARLYRVAGRTDDASELAAAATAASRAPGGSAPLSPPLPMWLFGQARSSAHAQTATATATAVATSAGCTAASMADIAREQPLAHAEASYRWFSAEAPRLEAAGDLASAMDAHLRIALLAAIIRGPDREQAAWAALQRLALARGETAAAALYGKRAVNAAQALRGQVEQMPRQARQAFLAERRRAYVALVQSMLDGQRLAEAEAVLRLLKEDEGQPFVPTAARPQRDTLPLTAAEAAWSGAFDALAARGRALHSERQAQHQGLGGIANAPRTRDAQEAMLIDESLRAGDDMLRALSGRRDDTEMRQARALIAKPRARRSAEEQMQVDLMHAILTRMLSGIDDLAAGLRALPRDAEQFRIPLTDAQRQRAGAIAQRLPPLRAALAADLAPLLAEPAAAGLRTQLDQMERLGKLGMPGSLLQPGQGAAIADMMLDAGLGGLTQGLRQAWAITRQLETLDADALALRQRLTAALTPPQALALDAAAEAQLATGQRTLAALPAGTVAVYYLQDVHRLDALVVDAHQRRAVRLAGGNTVAGAGGSSTSTGTNIAAELSTRIVRFRKALESGSLALLPEARALHDLLWRPLGLSGSAAGGAGGGGAGGTVMLSLDGALRALPFAALHDGKQWLIEQHAINIYTSAAPAALTARPAPQWRVAAFGASAGGIVDGKTLDPLVGVRAELAAIVKPASNSGAGAAAAAARGVLPGEVRLDAAFTAAALRDALARRPPVLHLASHFVFVAGDAQRSALLLGDGSALSVAELSSAAYKLDRVDLVTLSACQTALTGDDAFGQEVEGLGTLLQAQGAAAVLATLWSVNDSSTAAFMAAMYALRERDGLSRAEAVRQAQLKLLRGDLTPNHPTLVSAPGPRPAAAPAIAPAPQRGGQRDDDGAAGGGWSHPLHWAPFVLMGNWL